ncbi:MAG: CNNM domain-containing protein [Bacteroidales bacterium]|nr:CNNM domain-containing protein [Bacteroidales bacterium]
MVILFVYLGIDLFLSFLCSILEATLLSTSSIFINMKQKEGKKYAHWLDHYKKNIDLPLSAILTLNTFAHTIGAAGIGSQVQELWGSEYLAIASIILTLIILIGSEIIPKTLGALYWKELSRFTVYALRIMIYSPLYPFIILTNSVTRLFRKGRSGKSPISEPEFRAITDTVIENRVMDDEESRILQNLMRFQSILVKNIMTPQVVIHAADENTSMEQFYEKNQPGIFSRIPLYHKELNQFSGFVLRDEVMEAIIENRGGEPLKSIARPITAVNEDTPIIRLFSKLIERRIHMAIVVDEYGMVSGLVTMEDLFETLIGLEIVDEMDNVEDMQMLARKNWEARAKKLGLIE